MTAAPVFDAVIHAPGRLQICAILSSVDDAEFAMIRDAIKVSDSVMSKHLKQLEDARFVIVRKRFVERKPQTRILLSEAGTEAFARYLHQLQEVLARAKRLASK